MTVAALDPAVSYLEDGVTLAFPVPFRFKSGTDIKATRILAGGATVDLVYGTAYSVTGGATDAGGTLTLAATIAGSTLRIRRQTARAQQTQYDTNDRFPAESHEAALDRAMLIDQEQDQAIADTSARAVQVPLGQVAPAFDAAGLSEGDVLTFRSGKLQRHDRTSFINKVFGGSVDGGLVPMSTIAGGDAALRVDIATGSGSGFMGWLAPWINARLRTLYSRLTDGPIYVTDFMTAAEIADARARTELYETTYAFQRAFDAALANGKVVMVPEGKYVVGELLFGTQSTVAQSASPQGLIGNGKFSTILKAKPGGTGTLLQSWTLAGITFEHFGIDTTGSTMQAWACQWAVDEEIAPSTQNVIRDILITTHGAFSDGVTPHVNWDKNGDTFPQGVTVRGGSLARDNCMISMEQPGGITSASEIIWTGGFLRLNCQNARLNDCWGDGLQISDNANNNIDLANTYMYANPTYEACIWCETFDAFQGTKALRISGQLLCDNEDWAFVNVSAYSRVIFENVEFFGASRTLLGPDSRATGVSPAHVRIEGGYGSLDLVNIPSSGPSDPGIIVTAKDFKDPATGLMVTKDWTGTTQAAIAGNTAVGTASYTARTVSWKRFDNRVEGACRLTWSAFTGTGYGIVNLNLPFTQNGAGFASISFGGATVGDAYVQVTDGHLIFFPTTAGGPLTLPAGGDIDFSFSFHCLA